MTAEWVCWRCGHAIDVHVLGRGDSCGGCDADLHVCRLCVYFNESVSRQCAEPIADEVQNKERANFCGYFKPRPGAYRAAGAEAERARAALDAFFGGTPAAAAEAGAADAEQARRKLAELFGEPEPGGRR